jgi:hypothetical protein
MLDTLGKRRKNPKGNDAPKSIVGDVLHTKTEIFNRCEVAVNSNLAHFPFHRFKSPCFFYLAKRNYN